MRSLEGSIDEESDLSETHSLLLFSSRGDFRLTTTWLVQSEYFENFMMILIVASSVLLAWEKPLIDPRSDLAIGIGWAAETLNAIFVAEAVLKIIADGFLFCGPQSYILQNENVLDFVLVFLSIFSWSNSDTDKLQVLKMIRLIKVLRPLRMLTRDPQLKVTIDALWLSLPNVWNVLLISFVFFFCFGIIAVNLL